jgi:hypothetical protein
MLVALHFYFTFQKDEDRVVPDLEALGYSLVKSRLGLVDIVLLKCDVSLEDSRILVTRVELKHLLHMLLSHRWVVHETFGQHHMSIDVGGYFGYDGFKDFDGFLKKIPFWIALSILMVK